MLTISPLKKQDVFGLLWAPVWCTAAVKRPRLLGGVATGGEANVKFLAADCAQQWEEQLFRLCVVDGGHVAFFFFTLISFVFF